MALLKMEKVTLIAHSDNKEKILKALQSIGMVELISAENEETATARAPQELAALEAKFSEVRSCLETVRRYVEDKPSFLTPKPPISHEELIAMHGKFSEADEAISEIKKFSDNLSAIKNKRQRLHNRILQLAPFINFDAPLETVGEGIYTESVLGTLPPEYSDKLEELRAQYASLASFEKIDENKEYISIWAAAHKSVSAELFSALKALSFSEAFTKDIHGTPKEIMSGLEGEMAQAAKETEALEENAKQLTRHIPLLAAVEDYIANEAARERTFEKIGVTGTAFVLEGWCIADNEDKIRAAIEKSAPESYIDFTEPGEDEVPPTALRNAKPVQPFEAVTDMYSVPSSKGFDPNFVMSIFYFIVFGMMIGDAAYGALLSIGAFIVLKLKKPTGMFRKITTVLMICGISTIFWGLFFGTVFSIPNLMTPVLDPLNDAMLMLVLCLGIGLLHILVGLGTGLYVEAKSGHIWDGIFDKGSWMLILIGVVVLAVGFSSVGAVLIVAGFAMLLLTAGRHKKGILRKLTAAFSSLYGSTSYISDILSYSRIFGMGLATTVIAQLFNTLGSMLMGGVVGYVFGIVIMTFGHTFNIAINTMGAFVHSARLQYIEFYSKFYEGGGHAFEPLSVRTKNHRLVD